VTAATVAYEDAGRPDSEPDSGGEPEVLAMPVPWLDVCGETSDDAGGEDSVDVCSETDACAGAGLAISAMCRVADSLCRATHEPAPVPHACTSETDDGTKAPCTVRSSVVKNQDCVTVIGMCVQVRSS